MKAHLKCPKANYRITPYMLNKYGLDEELSFTLSDTEEQILFLEEQNMYMNIVCSIVARSEFSPATVSADYRNEIDKPFKKMQFNLYDGSSIDMNGIVSSIDVVIYESEIPIDQKVIYTKKFYTSQSRIIEVYETENHSGINTISNVHFFGGAYKPNMPLDGIQPYLFYLMHEYNNLAHIGIISATDFLNSKNNLIPAPNIKFEDLSTLYDDIVTGKIQLTLNNSIYRSISAVKNTLTNSLFILKLKQIS